MSLGQRATLPSKEETMSNIICLAVCIAFIAAFFAVPWVMVRREMDRWSPAPTKKERMVWDLAIAVLFFLLLSVVGNLVTDLSEGYAALYVWEVGWWTL
jgi:hypothetical protein